MFRRANLIWPTASGPGCFVAWQSARLISFTQLARLPQPPLCDSRRPRPTRVVPPSAQAGCSLCPPPRPPATSASARPTRAFPGRPPSPRWLAASLPLASRSARAGPPSWAHASSPPGTCGNRSGISGTRLRARMIETALAALAPRRRARLRRPALPTPSRIDARRTLNRAPKLADSGISVDPFRRRFLVFATTRAPASRD